MAIKLFFFTTDSDNPPIPKITKQKLDPMQNPAILSSNINDILSVVPEITVIIAQVMLWLEKFLYKLL